MAVCKTKIGAVLHKRLAVGGECFLAWPPASCPHFGTSSVLLLTGDNKPCGGGSRKAENVWCWVCLKAGKAIRAGTAFNMPPGARCLKQMSVLAQVAKGWGGTSEMSRLSGTADRGTDEGMRNSRVAERANREAVFTWSQCWQTDRAKTCMVFCLSYINNYLLPRDTVQSQRMQCRVRCG